ncbi:MAG: 8-oxo-dGTP diphosphatase MutT, partial [Steroidobacteraceae bacterium]
QEVQALPRHAGLTVVQVVAGILRDAEGRVLIAQRPAGKHMAGSWEFPGGKRRAGESAEAALARELREELGIEIDGLERFMTIDHEYPDRRVILETYLIRHCHGEVHGREGQAIRWCRVEELASAGILPADLPIVAALCAGGAVTQNE